MLNKKYICYIITANCERNSKNKSKINIIKYLDY